MKRKMILALLLGTAVLATGCSSGKKETEAPATEKAQTTVTEAAAETEAAAVQEAVSEAAGTLEEAVSEAGDAAQEAVSEAAGAAENAQEALSEAADTAQEAVSEAAGTLEEAVSEAEGAAQEAVSEAEAAVEEALSEAAAETVTEAATETAAEATTEAATEATTEAATEAATEATTEAATEAATEAPEEAVTEAAAEDVEAVTEGTEVEDETETAAPAVRPEYEALDYVTLGQYTDLPVEVQPIVITDEQVEESIKDRVLSAGIYDEVTDGTVQEGDVANIDFVGKKDGEAFEGGTAEGYDLTIGSGSFIPGFEEGLIGVSVGETVDLNLTFPEDYTSEELAGQETVFTVTVNSIQRPSEITDEVISKLTEGAYTTLDGYRAFVREDLEAQEKNTQDSTVDMELMTLLYNTCTVNEYPEELVQYSVGQMKDYYQQYADMYGVTFDEFISNYFGMDEETFNSEVEKAVTDNLQQELILGAIAEKENLQVTDEEYNQKAEEYALQFGYPDAETFKETYPREQIEHSITLDKAMTFVREHAQITVAETEAVTEAETAEPEEAEAVTEATTE